MEQSITIGKRKLYIKTTANSLFIYKAQFGRDGLKDRYKLLDPSLDRGEAAEIFLYFFWAFAKNYDPALKPIEEWDDVNAVIEKAPEIMDAINQFSKTTVKLTAPSSAKGGELTTEILLRRAIERGLSVSDFDRMTLGMILDYIVTCRNEDADKKEPKRMATQEDIDAW